MNSESGQVYFRKGFGLKAAVQEQLADDYNSGLVVGLKENDFSLKAERLEMRLAREFGFCYGVDRAVDYAYETRRKFPERQIRLIGEIIHNPGVNERLASMGIEFLAGPSEGGSLEDVGEDDVVIVPAFGVTSEWMTALASIGCVTVDTTCGSVLSVWKRVERYARDGFTSIIHGKHYHEETKATASRALSHPGGRYLVVRNMEEADIVAAYIRARGDHGEGAREAFMERFAISSSPGFDPDEDLKRVGLANQTTMLSSESLAVARCLGLAMEDVHGVAESRDFFRAFDTICSATQDRQDAVERLLETNVDLMIVIGGFNSSNTANLARLCEASVPAYHVSSSSCFRADGALEHLLRTGQSPVCTSGWLPDGDVVIGLTAGASTPDSEVGAVIQKLLDLAKIPLESVVFG